MRARYLSLALALAACKPSEQPATSVKSETSQASGASSGGECLGKPADVAAYMDKLKGANVLQTELSIPPAEAKGGAALTYDPKRRFLVCDAAGCLAKNGDGSGVTAKAAYGKSFAGALGKALGKCGKIAVLAPDVLPRAKVDEMLKALAKAKCSVSAVVRQSIQGLPKLEPSPELGEALKKMGGTKLGPARESSAAGAVKGATKKHGKACGKMNELASNLSKAKGYTRYDVAMKQLKGSPKALAPCFCALQPDDGKLVFQVATFGTLLFEMHFYKVRAVPGGVLTGKTKKKGKTWYELVAEL